MTYRPALETIRFLLSDQGAAWLDEAARLPGTPASHLADLSDLRRHLSPQQAAAVLEQVQLRARAAPRFERAAQMLFTAVGLQQSTHPLVAAHRAARFRGRPWVADLGCGLGADSLALAQVAGRVLALDRDPLRLLCARHNAAVHGLADRILFVQANTLNPPFLPLAVSLFGDPGRRSGSDRRTFRPQDYQPPLASLWERMRDGRGIAIKVAPGIDYRALPWVDEVEIVSLDGQVKEATLWCGDLATPGVSRRATLLPSGATVTGDQTKGGLPIKPAGRYLYEPDGAVIRAGLVGQMGAVLELWQLDPHIAYLSGDEEITSPLLQGFEIEVKMPFGLKSIRQRLRELDVGILEIKKRGVALDPDTFRRRLKLSGSESKTLIVTRLQDGPSAFICRRKTKLCKS
jgi:SAM-dependent methyltransferase